MLHFEKILNVKNLNRLRSAFKATLDALNKDDPRSGNPGIAAGIVLMKQSNMAGNVNDLNRFHHYLGMLVAQEDMKHTTPFCYMEMIEKKSLYAYIMGFYQMLGAEPPLAEQSFRSTLMFHLACHFEAGNWVYQITHGLSESLKDTELRGLQTDDLQLPYPAIYIEAPKNSGLKVWNNDSGWHDLIGMYIVEDPKHYHTLEGLIEPKELKGLPSSRAWRFILVGAPKGSFKFGGISFEDDALSFFRIALVPGQSLDQAINHLEKQMEREREQFSTTFGEMATYWIVPFQWAMNAVLYATHVEKGREIVLNKEVRQLKKRIEKLPRGKKRSGLQNKLRGMDSRRRIILGDNITVDRSKEAEESGVGTGNKLTVRVKVPGHWRRVCYGPQGSLRRWQHIKSYWKGPEDGVFRPKKHTLR